MFKLVGKKIFIVLNPHFLKSKSVVLSMLLAFVVIQEMFSIFNSDNEGLIEKICVQSYKILDRGSDVA